LSPPLEPLYILAFIKFDLPDIWKGASISTGMLAGKLDIELKPDVATRTWQKPGKKLEPLYGAMQKPESQAIVAKLFRVPDLFTVSTYPELTAMLRAEWPEAQGKPRGQPAALPAQVVTIERNSVQDGWFAPNAAVENQLIEKLALKLNLAAFPITYWPAPRFCGANFISREILPKLDPEKFSRIFAISPSNLEKAYEAELNKIRASSGIAERSDEALERLVDWLYATKTLVVVNDYEHFQGDLAKPSLSLKRLIALLQRNSHGPRRGNPVLLLVGSTDYRGETPLLENGHFEKLTTLNHLLSVPRKERFDFFLRQFDHFQSKRLHGHIYDQNGFRTKRARVQLSLRDNREKRPIDIRLRALFASNRDNHAYFDPTGGFSKLVGQIEGDLPRQVERYVEEVLLYLNSKTLGKKRTEIRVLRWLSTAAYWLTVPALEQFCKVTNHSDIETVTELLRTEFADVVQAHPHLSSGEEPTKYTT